MVVDADAAKVLGSEREGVSALLAHGLQDLHGRRCDLRADPVSWEDDDAGCNHVAGQSERGGRFTELSGAQKWHSAVCVCRKGGVECSLAAAVCE